MIDIISLKIRLNLITSIYTHFRTSHLEGKTTNRNLCFASYNLGTSCFTFTFLFYQFSLSFKLLIKEQDFIFAFVKKSSSRIPKKKKCTIINGFIFYNLNATTSLWPLNYIKIFVQKESAGWYLKMGKGLSVGCPSIVSPFKWAASVICEKILRKFKLNFLGFLDSLLAMKLNSLQSSKKSCNFAWMFDLEGSFIFVPRLFFIWSNPL